MTPSQRHVAIAAKLNKRLRALAYRVPVRPEPHDPRCDLLGEGTPALAELRRALTGAALSDAMPVIYAGRYGIAHIGYASSFGQADAIAIACKRPGALISMVQVVMSDNTLSVPVYLVHGRFRSHERRTTALPARAFNPYGVKRSNP